MLCKAGNHLVLCVTIPVANEELSDIEWQWHQQKRQWNHSIIIWITLQYKTQNWFRHESSN